MSRSAVPESRVMHSPTPDIPSSVWTRTRTERYSLKTTLATSSARGMLIGAAIGLSIGTARAIASTSVIFIDSFRFRGRRR